MASIKFGINTIDKLMIGSGEVDALYLGSIKMYEKIKYTLIPTVTNVSISPVSAIVASGGSQTFTLSADGTSYKLPTSIIVADIIINAGTSTTISGKCTVLFTRTSDTSGTILLSNVVDNVTFSVTGEPATKPMPTKGQLITMDLSSPTPSMGTSNQYRVLKVISGTTNALVQAMFATSYYGAFDTYGYSTYNNSVLDTYLNQTWYNALSTTAKNAIQTSTITQYQYSGTDYTTKSIYQSNLTKKVFALDFDDIVEYIGKYPFESVDIWTMYYNLTEKPTTYWHTWTRSADSQTSGNCLFVHGSWGSLQTRVSTYTRYAVPAFVIDLSKISWS